MNKLNKYFFYGCIIGAIGLGTHLILFDPIAHILNENMANVKILHPPYPAFINIAAWLTAIFPGIGVIILYSLIHENLKFKNKLVKGLVFAILLLLVEGSLIRQPIMNILVGNPTWIALVQQLNSWLPTLLMSLAAAFLINKKN